jgi:pSer/pThr/pTyr-binding forkhead associated (FHA) protein
MIRYWLTIVQGPDRGREYDLEDNEIVVGRHPDSGININDTEVSRKHFVLNKKADEYWIEDLDSTNGTVVNGRPIKSEYRLRDNSKINLGANISLVFNKDVPLPDVKKTLPIKIEQETEEENKTQPVEKAEEKPIYTV